MRLECDGCGLAACDLPDGVDPELIFEGDGHGGVWCPVCLPADEVRPPRCSHCLDEGHVCENHPEFPWDVTVEGHAPCGGAGMPCLACCSPIPEDGTRSIAEAFTPDWMRGQQ